MLIINNTKDIEYKFDEYNDIIYMSIAIYLYNIEDDINKLKNDDYIGNAVKTIVESSRINVPEDNSTRYYFKHRNISDKLIMLQFLHNDGNYKEISVNTQYIKIIKERIENIINGFNPNNNNNNTCNIKYDTR